MNFQFESKRKSGNCGTKEEPDFAAVKVSVYKEKNRRASSNVVRLRFAFTEKAVRLARWIKGDSLEVGGDAQNMMLAFKRSPSGYRIIGKQFTEKTKDRPSIQVTVDSDSAVSLIASLCLGVWIPLHESGLLLVTSAISESPR